MPPLKDQLKVEAYAGARLAEYPVRFELAGRQYVIQRILQRAIVQNWQRQTGRSFTVETTSGERFRLIYWEQTDSWELAST